MPKLALALAALSLTTLAHAGTYEINHGQGCPALRKNQVFDTINQVGIEEDLHLPTGRRINGEMHCGRHPTLTDNGIPVYMYLFRVTIEKQISDGGVKHWVLLKPNLVRYAYGVKAQEFLAEEIQKETRTLVRMLK